MKFRLSFTLVALALVAAGCGDDDPAPPTTGAIGVTTVTTGDDIDADGYTLSVDGNNGGAIGVNAVVIIPDLTPGTYSIGLGGVAANCAVQNNPRDVDVTAGLTENTQFDVACALLNQPPVADAGMDQTVTDADDSGAEDVTLDGSASTDADGTIASWSWAVDGTEIATGEMATVSFDVGVTTVVLTVTDDGGATGTDEVMITVEAAPAPISFATQIQPYFEAAAANCVACHSGGTGIAGVDLDSYANIMAGGDNGPLVVAGDSQDATALLVPKLNADHNDGPDDAGFVVTLSQWIDEGALDN
ncbi:MAG: hypothetical protein JRG67_08955 [Deltaproteobacteria bacterium]|nr:hypothetical protein [Deltaproteobacteria bacterium]